MLTVAGARAVAVLTGDEELRAMGRRVEVARMVFQERNERGADSSAARALFLEEARAFKDVAAKMVSMGVGNG